MLVTESQKQRVQTDWELIAKESLIIETGETVQDPIIAYGSELAILRLFHTFAGGPGKAAYSANLKTWYFVNK